MKTGIRWIFFTITAFSLAMLWSYSDTEAGKAKGQKLALSSKMYKELISRDLKVIEKSLGTKKLAEVDRARVSAAMIVAYTMNLGDKVGNPEGVRAAALKLSAALTDNNQAEARKLIKAIAGLKGIESAKEEKINFKSLILDDDHLMLAFEMKEKGGDPLHPDLQVSKRLQGSQEGIENFINYLARRPLRDTYMKKAAKEIVPLGYWISVSGDVTLHLKPRVKKGKDDADVWSKTAIQMRDAGVDLAEAAAKMDADALNKAAANLQASCLACHRIYRVE